MFIELTEREKTVATLRNSGKTYREISNALGISKGRAREIYKQVERKEKENGHFTDGLSTRAFNCLKNFNIESQLEAAIAIKSGRMRPASRKDLRKLWPNYRGGYGIKTHIEICKWLGLPKEDYEQKKCICSSCGAIIRKKNQSTKI